MGKVLLSIVIFFAAAFCVNAANVNSLTWAQVCSGNMGAAWYSSQEARDIADVVLSVQKNNGGWMKNDQLHKLSPSELSGLLGKRHEHSCLDNYATTQEMRFLAKVYKGTGNDEYRGAFVKALNMIFAAEKNCGGWSQYWPLSGNGSYQDYITFNDDLVTNVMKILRDIYENKGDFENIVDEWTREKCQAAFQRTIDMIIRCQVDDNGTKAAWCAQHDTIDMLPVEGRPHELPSISGSESATLLSFLMTVENPSKELQSCITSAVEWLDTHKIEGKAIEDFTNGSGERDRRVVDRPGSAIWGRFIQIGGESGRKIYDKFFNMLKKRNKSRSYTYNGKVYTYKEYEIATVSYNEERAYQPIFAIYSNDYQHLFYRFLYNYEDTDPVVDNKGLPVATSLTAGNRSSYQYLGSWCLNVINVEYPAWKRKMDDLNAAGDAKLYEISNGTYQKETIGDGANVWHFSNGFTVSNTRGKGYSTGKTNTVKYSAGVDYSIDIPNDLKVVKASLYGYDNYDEDAYLRSFNGTSYTASDYVFPAKVTDPVYVSYMFDMTDNPVSGTLSFSLAVKQCCIILNLYCKDIENGISEIGMPQSAVIPVKHIEQGRMIIIKGDRKFNINGCGLK
ncbi:pectate lyase [Xylanibacter muris]|uniref:Pectate lyase n=1 Tax=Xylanibacter muris TaxID=2736290 RepID=A0ABX2AKC8_9BACT|nr:pectate lyase [Xylanibacter muris]NPD91656.1 pectate lyase [Xylanibacter muris]